MNNMYEIQYMQRVCVQHFAVDFVISAGGQFGRFWLLCSRNLTVMTSPCDNCLNAYTRGHIIRLFSETEADE